MAAAGCPLVFVPATSWVGSSASCPHASRGPPSPSKQRRQSDAGPPPFAWSVRFFPPPPPRRRPRAAAASRDQSVSCVSAPSTSAPRRCGRGVAGCVRPAAVTAVDSSPSCGDFRR
ncbi:hypothetical protein I4F81_007932 [Pyropia yezoensis]|uniref:Uncharacterized protein n=1 Tax=Pyropia yezoensis TaxID=2788 RepID=A0ACC3C5X1_PYRYE|nr:hypothetical protein I4F81_007932 [Neopyropia yezoensis]